jgi:hypothetical protein
MRSNQTIKQIHVGGTEAGDVQMEVHVGKDGLKCFEFDCKKF